MSGMKELSKEEQESMEKQHLAQMSDQEKGEYFALKERLSKLSPAEKKAEVDRLQQEHIMSRLTPQQQIEYLEKKKILDAMTPEEREKEMMRLRELQMEEARQAMQAMQMGVEVTPEQREMVHHMQRQAQMNMKAQLKAQYNALSPEKKAELEKKKEKVKAVIKKLKLSQQIAHTYLALFGQVVNHPVDQTEEQKQSGLAHKNACDKLFARTDLSPEVLAKVWEMSDKEQRNALDEADFISAMILIARAQNKLKLRLQPHHEEIPMVQFQMESWELDGTGPPADGEERKDETKPEEEEDEMPALE